ncbi:MAG: CoA transferase [Dehalococcoidia bacterium]|nr:CoA transferase [Dehalococcoidia bacterium]
MATGALHGVRVLEFTQIIAAPLAGSVLADLGADVVKVEPPGGENLRTAAGVVPGTSKSFQWLNRGKRSLVVDLTDPRGQALVHRIVPSFDVVTTNYRPPVVRRLKIDYETLSRFRPDLIYAQISGFGSHGPRADEPLIDMVAQAYSGYLAEVGVVDDLGGPRATHGSTMDAATAFAAVIGVVSALYHRTQSGEGQFVDVSLLRAAMALIGSAVMREPVSDSVIFGPRLAEAHARFARGDDYASVLRDYKATATALAATRQPFLAGYMAKDGPVFIGAYTAVMRGLARKALSIPDDGSDRPDFDPLAPDVLAIAARTRQAMVDAVHSRTADEFVRELLAVGVPVSRVHLPGEVADDPQASEFMAEIEDELSGPQRQLSGLFEMSKTPVRPAGPAPMLGRHTDEVLTAAGISADEIAELRAAGTIA